MRSRCNNPNFPRYPDYGGRGLTVFPAWDSYEQFKKWSLDNGYAADLLLERKENARGYSPENCRWATCREQARNKRNNRLLTAFGETKTMAEWYEDPRCAGEILRNRLHQGWDVERAITQPLEKVARHVAKLITFNGETLTINGWATRLNMLPSALYARFNRGLTPDEILAPVRPSAPYGSRKKNSH